MGLYIKKCCGTDNVQMTTITKSKSVSFSFLSRPTYPVLLLIFYLQQEMKLEWPYFGGRGGIKMGSAKNNQLISSQGPHYSPRSTAKTNDKSTNLRKNGICWYK